MMETLETYITRTRNNCFGLKKFNSTLHRMKTGKHRKCKLSMQMAYWVMHIAAILPHSCYLFPSAWRVVLRCFESKQPILQTMVPPMGSNTIKFHMSGQEIKNITHRKGFTVLFLKRKKSRNGLCATGGFHRQLPLLRPFKYSNSTELVRQVSDVWSCLFVKFSLFVITSSFSYK